jgi:hypothetical protein
LGLAPEIVFEEVLMRLTGLSRTSLFTVRRRCAYAAISAVLAVPSWAAADPIPITVTAGETFLYWDASRSSFSLSGDGFSMFGEHHGGGTLGWEVGSTATLDGSFEPLTPSGDEDGLVRVIVNDVPYSAFLAGTINLTTCSFIVPPLPSGASQVFTLPFTASGRIRGYAQPFDTTNLLFDIDLRGAGTATATATGTSGGTFVLTPGIRYAFEDASAPAPVPEPGTMFLLATGLAGLVRFTRDRNV